MKTSLFFKESQQEGIDSDTFQQKLSFKIEIVIFVSIHFKEQPKR